ncbi:MAG: hypothetical protein RSD07_06155 [Angelakisella sp.]
MTELFAKPTSGAIIEKEIKGKQFETVQAMVSEHPEQFYSMHINALNKYIVYKRSECHA